MHNCICHVHVVLSASDVIVCHVYSTDRKSVFFLAFLVCMCAFKENNCQVFKLVVLVFWTTPKLIEGG